MKAIDFPAERSCPLCQGGITRAERKSEYEPVVVVVCPHCSRLLWRPGLEEDGQLFAFDPDSGEDGI